MTAHRTRRNGGFGAQRDLIFQQTALALLIHDQHDDIGVGNAELKAEAAAFHPDGRRRPKACMILAAHRVPSAEFRADAECRLLHPGYDDDAVCLLQ